MVCHTISKERTNLSNQDTLQRVVAIMSLVPVYQAKIERMKKTMEATTALIAKVDKQVWSLKQHESAAAAGARLGDDDFAAARSASFGDVSAAGK
jgi:hypothetical protein